MFTILMRIMREKGKQQTWEKENNQKQQKSIKYNQIIGLSCLSYTSRWPSPKKSFAIRIAFNALGSLLIIN